MKKDKYRILLVDDEEDILEFLGYNLKKEGYKVYKAVNGLEAVEKAKAKHPDLILMDVMMPEMDGITAVQEIRKIPKLEEILVVFLTARSDDHSQIAGFEAGADDYVSKPVKIKVLMSRIHALLRRTSKKTEEKSLIKIKGLAIDNEKYSVKKNGKEITLPKKEFLLLNLLAGSPNKVFSREEILSKVWGEKVVVGDRTIDVHVRKIREKIGMDYISTLKGVGYRFND